MRRAWPFGLALAACLDGSTARADPRADDDDGPVTIEATSDVASHSKRAFDAGLWREVAPWLHRVARGEFPDGARSRELAEYRLAVSLHELGLHRASLAVFAPMADRRAHIAHDGAMRWLARLARELPEPAGFVEPIGKYQANEIATLRGMWPDDHATLSYWSGRVLARRGAREEAIARLDGVARGAKEYLPAQIERGTQILAMRGRVVDAVVAFFRVIEAVDAEAEPSLEHVRLRDLAIISTARAYYTSVATSFFDGSTFYGSRLRTAVKSWSRIAPTSEHYRAALLERPWAFFLDGDYDHALGDLHTARSPFLSANVPLEADKLEGIINFSLCRYDDAVTVIARQKLRGDAQRRAFEGALAQLAGEGGERRLWERIEKARAGTTAPEDAARLEVELLLGDRPLLRHVDYARALDAERARFDALPKSFRSSELGEEIRELLRIERASVPATASALARDRYLRAITEIDASLLDGTKLLHDVALARSQPHAAPTFEPSFAWARRRYQDDEHVVWPFDGEYWRDEIGSYRVITTSACAP